MKKINTACLWNLRIYNKNNHKTKEPWAFHQTKIFVIENSAQKKEHLKLENSSKPYILNSLSNFNFISKHKFHLQYIR